MNEMNVFNTLLSKQHKIFLQAFTSQELPHEHWGSNVVLAMTLQANIESLGFSFSQKALYALSHMDEKELTQFWSHFKAQAQQMVGAHRYFKPMYPNFPEQVMQASDLELMLNAFVHYLGDWIGLRILPAYNEQVRLPLVDKVSPKLLDIGTLDDIKSLFGNLLNANSSLSESDKQNIVALFTFLHDKGMARELIQRSNIVQKENLAFIGSMVLQSSLDFNTLLAPQFKTPTDVLRLVAAMFGGDVSLAKPTRFGKVSRPMRKAILARLETQFMQSADVDQLIENMFDYKERWVRFAHAVHAGEYGKLFPLTVSVFNDLRQNNRPVTFNSKLTGLLQGSDEAAATDMLVTRPGVFARHLNMLLSIAQGKTLEHHDNASRAEYVLRHFARCSKDVATPVLLQLHSHFKHQHEKTVRTFMPKGGLGKLYVMDDDQHKHMPINQDLAQQVVQICEKALTERFGQFSALGNVYVDPALKEQFVPFAQRSASKALASVARGSRFDVQEQDKDVVRLFLWWNETGVNRDGQRQHVGRVDIDLSCILMDENYKALDVCSYWSLRDSAGVFAHSGDITSAPNGACEFIDVNLKKLDSNVRYLVMTVSSYTQQKYCDLPECFAGWMMREKPQAGKVFDARTVQNKVDITADSTQMMPAIFDTQTRQFIWADIAVKANDVRVNNVANNINSIGYAVKAITNLVKPTLYDLFMLHAKARGCVVQDKSLADKVFSLHEGVTPYMFDVITSEFMADSAPDKV